VQTWQRERRADDLRDRSLVMVGGAALTATLFVAIRGGLDVRAFVAAFAGGAAAWAMYYAVLGLVGRRLAAQITLWLTLALVVMVLAPMMELQFYAGLAVIGLWTRCIAFGDELA